MAKKDKKPTIDEQVEVVTNEEKVEDTKVETQDSKPAKKEKKSKEVKVEETKETKSSKDKSKSKPKKEKKSLKRKAQEVISELKKVSKPSFGKVVKNTCVVISVVAICTLLLFGMDKLFSLLYDLLLP